MNVQEIDKPIKDNTSKILKKIRHLQIIVLLMILSFIGIIFWGRSKINFLSQQLEETTVHLERIADKTEELDVDKLNDTIGTVNEIIEDLTNIGNNLF